MRRAARWLANMVVLAASVAIAMVLTEAGLRVFYPQPLGVWHHDANGLALHWPGLVTYLPQFGRSVSFNSVGMRDREHRVENPAGVFRVLVLGDSFMEALQVPFEASFPSVLERRLEAGAGRPVEIINASVSGWGTDDELQYLATYGMRWRPDLIVVAMTLHNDISDNARQRFHTVRNGALIAEPRDAVSPLGYALVQLKGFLATRSHAYQLVTRVRRAREMAVEEQHLNSHVVSLFRQETDEALAGSLRLTSLLLERIRVVAGAEASRVVLVLLPLGVQVSDATFAQFARRVTGTASGLQLDRPQRVLGRLADDLDIPVIDLLPGFRAWTSSGGSGLYMQQDGHWNERGHRLAAEIVAREMIARHFIPPCPSRESRCAATRQIHG